MIILFLVSKRKKLFLVKLCHYLLLKYNMKFREFVEILRYEQLSQMGCAKS